MTITYILNEYGTWAQRLEDGEPTGKWKNTEQSKEYLDWVKAGNTPLSYVAPEVPSYSTTEEKVTHLLTDYGLTRDELRSVLESTSS